MKFLWHRKKIARKIGGVLFFLLGFVFWNLYGGSLMQGNASEGILPLSGSGTKENPYTIATQEDFLVVSGWVEQGNSFAGQYLELTKDIDFKTGLQAKDIFPIGKNERYPFAGCFNGNGYHLTNLNLTREEDYTGVFGYLAGGTITNLEVLDAQIEGTNYVGGIVGYNVGEITECIFAGTVSGKEKVGGIAGGNKSFINHCSSHARVSAAKGSCGGIVAENLLESAKILNSSYTGSIDEIEGDFQCVGGIAGSNAGDIGNCYNVGTIDAKKSSYGDIGGIVGSNYGKVNNAFYKGKILNVGTNTAGGIAGYNWNIEWLQRVYYNLASIKEGVGSEIGNSAGVYGLQADKMQGNSFVELLNQGIAQETSYRYWLFNKTEKMPTYSNIQLESSEVTALQIIAEEMTEGSQIKIVVKEDKQLVITSEEKNIGTYCGAGVYSFIMPKKVVIVTVLGKSTPPVQATPVVEEGIVPTVSAPALETPVKTAKPEEQVTKEPIKDNNSMIGDIATSAPKPVEENKTNAVKKIARTLVVGKSYQVKDTGELSYKTENKKIATVNKNGKVTAKAPGKTKIKVFEKSNHILRSSITVSVKPKRPTINSISISHRNIKIKWGKIAGITGYEMKVSKKKNGTYKRVGLKKSTDRVMLDQQKKGTYYYKVRCYKTVEGKKIYSQYSNIIKIVVK